MFIIRLAAEAVNLHEQNCASSPEPEISKSPFSSASSGSRGDIGGSSPSPPSLTTVDEETSSSILLGLLAGDVGCRKRSHFIMDRNRAEVAPSKPVQVSSHPPKKRFTTGAEADVMPSTPDCGRTNLRTRYVLKWSGNTPHLGPEAYDPETVSSSPHLSSRSSPVFRQPLNPVRKALKHSTSHSSTEVSSRSKQPKRDSSQTELPKFDDPVQVPCQNFPGVVELLRVLLEARKTQQVLHSPVEENDNDSGIHGDSMCNTPSPADAHAFDPTLRCQGNELVNPWLLKPPAQSPQPPASTLDPNMLRALVDLFPYLTAQRTPPDPLASYRSFLNFNGGFLPLPR